MFQLQINEKGGPSRQETFDKAEITIGRVQGNDIILPKGNISKRHSRIVLKDGKFIIVDLKSTNGTYVNGKKITGAQVVKASDKIYIGDFTLQLNGAGGAASAADAPKPAQKAAPPQDQEIDLFGGDAPPLDDGPSGTPGLIDDNFDQDFEAAEPPPKKPSKRPEPAPDPVEDELNLDDDFGVDPLDLAPPPDLEPEPEFEPEPELDLAPEPEAPSRQKRAKPPKPQPAKPKEPTADLEPEPEGLSLAAPTLRPDPVPVAIASAPVAAAAAQPSWDRPTAVEQLHQEAVEFLGLGAVGIDQLAGRHAHVERWVAQRAADYARAGLVGAGEDHAALAREVADQATDVSLLQDLLSDESVVEIEITPAGVILADREGQLEPTGDPIRDPARVIELIKKLGVLGGARPSAESPAVDVRLSDGSRVVAALPPLSFRGPTLSIRRPLRDYFTLDKLLEFNTVSKPMMTFIDYCVRYRKNILVTTGPGVTPTATLNALLERMPTDDRVVAIENGVELHLGGSRNLTSFEPRAGLTPDVLVAHATAMQADRVLVGGLDTEGADTILRAVAGPLEGSVVAIVANSPQDALTRLVNVNLAGVPDAADLVAAAFPVIVHEQRFLDNSRRIGSVCEAIVEDDHVRAREIFRFTPEGVDDRNVVTGSFASAGQVPKFIEEMAARGEIEADLSIFDA